MFVSTHNMMPGRCSAAAHLLTPAEPNNDYTSKGECGADFAIEDFVCPPEPEGLWGPSPRGDALLAHMQAELAAARAADADYDALCAKAEREQGAAPTTFH